MDLIEGIVNGARSPLTSPGMRIHMTARFDKLTIPVLIYGRG
jgi:hypothetical protein